MWRKSSVKKEKPIIFKWKKNLKRFKFVQFYQQKKKKSYNSNRPQKTKNSVAFLLKLCNYKQTIKKRKIPHEPDSQQYWTVRVSFIHINRKFGSTKTPKFHSKQKHSKLCGEKEINCTKIANAFRRLNSAIIIIASKKRSDINKEFLPSVWVYIYSSCSMFCHGICWVFFLASILFSIKIARKNYHRPCTHTSTPCKFVDVNKTLEFSCYFNNDESHHIFSGNNILFVDKKSHVFWQEILWIRVI